MAYRSAQQASGSVLALLKFHRTFPDRLLTNISIGATATTGRIRQNLRG